MLLASDLYKVFVAELPCSYYCAIRRQLSAGILQALADPATEVAGVSTVFGNARVDQVAHNTARVLTLADRYTTPCCAMQSPHCRRYLTNQLGIQNRGPLICGS